MKNTTALFLIVIALGVFFTFTRPTYSSMQPLISKAAEYRGVLDNLSSIVEERDRLLLNYNSISKSEIERLSKLLPQNVDTVRLAHELDAIGSRYGIAVSQVSIEDDAQKKNNQIILAESGRPYESSYVSVTFVSNYENFRRFLEDLERSLRIMDVRSVSFNTSDTGLYEHQVLLETYWVR